MLPRMVARKVFLLCIHLMMMGMMEVKSGEEPQANREGNMKDDLVDYKVDPYKEALCNLTEGR
jgi:hypothetical protein